MKYGVFVTAFWLLMPLTLIAQESESADSIYKRIQDNYRVSYDSLNALGESEAIDSLFINRGLKMARVYDQFPETEIGIKALEKAFGAWLNTDSLETMESYLERVSPNNSSWQVLANWYRIGLKNRQLDSKHFYDFADRYLQNENTTNLETISYLNYQMARIELSFFDEPELAISRFERIIEINIDEREVDAAKRDLYDLVSLKEGSPAPIFTAVDLNGKEISLSDLKGKYVFLEFWATWCGPCIPEIPYLKEVYQEFGSKDDFVMIGISLDDDEELLEDFLKENEMYWYQILDGNGENKWRGELGNLYAVGNGIPKTFLIDKEGVIISTDLRKDDIISELTELYKD